MNTSVNCIYINFSYQFQAKMSRRTSTNIKTYNKYFKSRNILGILFKNII